MKLAHEDRVQAKAAFLPSVNALNQYLYTQGNGTPTGVFVANNGVHVYNEQAVVHEELSFARRAEYRRALAAEAVARARQDVALRGLVATVAQSYYGLVVAEREGNWMIYRLPEPRPPELEKNLRCLQDCAQEDRQFRDDLAKLKRCAKALAASGPCGCA